MFVCVDTSVVSAPENWAAAAAAAGGGSSSSVGWTSERRHSSSRFYSERGVGSLSHGVNVCRDVFERLIRKLGVDVVQ